MALIGINPTDYAPRKRSTMDSILAGAQIAHAVLGTAASAKDIYSEMFGDKKKLLESQIKKNEADALATIMQAQREKEVKNPLLDPAIKGLTDQGLIVTTDKDPDEKKYTTYLPGMNDPVWVKPSRSKEMEREKIYNLEDAMKKDFNSLDEVQRFKQTHEAAIVASKLASKEQPTRSDDLALLSQFIKMQQPNARFNGENIDGVDVAISPAVSQAVQMYKKLFTEKAGLMDAQDRSNLIGTIQTQYETLRPMYDEVFKAYSQDAQRRGVQATARQFEKISFPKLSTKEQPTKPSKDLMQKIDGALQ